ncbi:MAG: hypothetical protein JW885_07455 [Deltaproteobacteria bacterium]|nr:hypothetical protein [Candidatus Zymogenaceae bacterium]
MDVKPFGRLANYRDIFIQLRGITQTAQDVYFRLTARHNRLNPIFPAYFYQRIHIVRVIGSRNDMKCIDDERAYSRIIAIGTITFNGTPRKAKRLYKSLAEITADGGNQYT